MLLWFKGITVTKENLNFCKGLCFEPTYYRNFAVEQHGPRGCGYNGYVFNTATKLNEASALGLPQIMVVTMVMNAIAHLSC